MALSSTVHRLKISLNDVDRGVYESLETRIARHPSETAERLVARALAYALVYEEGLEIGPGVCVGDEPAMSVRSGDGRLLLYVDIGSPSGERLHRASKAAERLVVFTHLDPAAIQREASTTRIHRASEIEVIAFDRAQIAGLAGRLDRTITWEVLRSEGHLYVTHDGTTFDALLTRVDLGDAR